MQTTGIPKVPSIVRFFSFYDSASISHDKWKQVIHCRSPQAATLVSEPEPNPATHARRSRPPVRPRDLVALTVLDGLRQHDATPHRRREPVAETIRRSAVDSGIRGWSGAFARDALEHRGCVGATSCRPRSIQGGGCLRLGDPHSRLWPGLALPRVLPRGNREPSSAVNRQGDVRS